ncbi:NUDIX hydrolase [Aquimarina agarivorans]|uniref:NUDIX hydrolase n=1 Tax=Aquimarina agarivorans TaxID=980584 RepID=UPI000248E7A1|nr:CoA pyrophosphatase [Aquimarina agarivorans]
MQLSPKERVEFSKNYTTLKTREAGVMALLYPKKGVTYLVLILRTTYDGAHSGQVALPGGKREKSDYNLWETALREVEEEIGIRNSDITLIKPLTSLYVPTSDFRVYPFLATSTAVLQFTLQETEVAELIEMPLSYLIEHKKIDDVVIEVAKKKFLEVPAFEFKQQIIWGATAMILNELKQLLIDSFDV